MRLLWIAPVLLALASATTTLSDDAASLMTLQGTKDPLSIEVPKTGTYESVTTTITVSTSGSLDLTTTPTASASANASDTTGSAAASTTTSASITLLVGGQGDAPNATANGTMAATSATSSTALPTNTQPCNGYPEFCARNYSNITVVAAHNSPFVRPGSFAANQQYPVTTQLNDGIRMRRLPVDGFTIQSVLC